MDNFMIDIDNVTFKYASTEEQEGKVVIKGVNLKVSKGEFVVVLGHNGSGKSTIAKHINALLTPSSGTVLVDGMDIRSKAGMVFQNPDNQLVATIVEEDVAFGPENLGVDPKEIRKRVDDSLAKVGMSEYKRHAPHLLSGGQKQRVAIAGVLAMQPDCIVFDEPTAMLDPSGRKEVINNIKELNKQQIRMEGTPREVFSKVDVMKKIGLDVPQVTELAYELRKEGIDISTEILNIDEMVDAVCQLK